MTTPGDNASPEGVSSSFSLVEGSSPPERVARSNNDNNRRASGTRARDKKFGTPGLFPGAQSKQAKRKLTPDEISIEKILQCLNAFLRTVNVAVSGNYQLDPRTVTHWVGLCRDKNGDWMKVAKYKRDAFLAYHFKTEPVEPIFSDNVKDCPGRLFNGPLHKILDSAVRKRKNYTKAQHRRRHEVLQTLTTVKLICPRPDRKMLTSNVEATVNSLRTAPVELQHVDIQAPKDWRRRVQSEDGEWLESKDGDTVRVDRKLIRNTIRAILQQVVSRKRWRGGACLNDVFFPPTRANYEYSVSRGGGVTGLCQDADINLDDHKVDGGLLPVICEKQDGECVGYFMFRYDKVDTAQQDYTWANVLSRIRACDSVQVLKPIGLAEPLKVRVITKGDWRVFMALRNLQQFLAKELKAHPSFVLTGTPVTVDIISSLGPLGPDEKFLNGDYTAATNNIRSWISRIYVEELCDHLNLSQQLSFLLMDGMVNNMIEDLNGVQAEQRSGQPMGFNNSFIGLCVCNAAIALITRAADNGGADCAPYLKLAESRILVNGDDLAMPVTDYGYGVWQRIGAWVGLSPSVGKTYFTDEFCQINSRNFMYVDGEYLPVRSINMGLLEGAAKKGKHVDEMALPCALSQLANNYRQLMEDCDGDLDAKGYVHRLFTAIHKDKLDRAEVPWYVPCWAGGLGLTGYLIPGEQDRRGMHEIRLNIKKYNPKSIPVQEDANNGEPDKQWYVHQLASDLLPVPSRTFNPEHPGILPYQQACARVAVDMLFDAERKIDELFRGDSLEDRAWKNLRHNRKIWKGLFGRNLPDPVKPFECLERTCFDCFPLMFRYPYGSDEDDFEIVDDRIDPPDGCPDGYLLRDK